MRTRARSLSSFGQARVTASSPPDIPTVLHSSRSGCGGAVELTKKPGYRSGRNNRQPKYPPGSLADPALPVGNRTAGTKCRRDAHPNGAKRVRVMWRGRATGPKGAAAPAAAGEHCLSSPPPWALRQCRFYDQMAILSRTKNGLAPKGYGGNVLGRVSLTETLTQGQRPSFRGTRTARAVAI